MAASAPRRLAPVLAGAAALAVALRLAGLYWGLPNTPNADEPHLVNLAVSFGGGSLRPYALKYPTFWPYLLFAAYGVYFLAWSGFGLRKTVADFAALFAWRPTGFYLIARALAAALSLAGAWLIYRHEREERPRAWPWAAALLAFSPVLIELAHSAKPDCLMFACLCAGWVGALRVLRGGTRADYLLSGAGFGAAVASQFTAAPAVSALVVAHFASPKRPPFLRLAEAAAVSFGTMFMASPFVVIDWRRVLEGMRDMGALMALKSYSFPDMLRQVCANAFAFAGAGSIAGAAALAGAASLWSRDRRRLAVLGAPVLLYILLISRYHDGGWPRYIMGCFPGLAFLAAEGLERARERAGRPWVTALLAVLALGPGAAVSWQADARMRLPDTRAEAAEWIAAHVPQGAGVLLDLPHASPDLPMTREEAEELAQKTAAAGSPRARLFRALARAHPGGGWRILRVRHTAQDLSSGPRHVELSQADAPVIDLSGGLAPVRAAGVSFVVTSNYGATRATLPQAGRFFDELETQGRLLAAFGPVAGESDGPTLRVFALK
jgi:hypothetical protein